MFNILPFEIVLQIFDYLRLLDVWALQAVSKQWHKTLSSQQFLRSVVSRWDSHDPSDSARPLGAVLKDPIESRIRHIRALTLKRPFTEIVINDTGTGIQGPHPQLSQCRFDLKGNKLAYVSSQPGDGDSVISRDLISGTTKTFRGEARERIMSVVLTTNLVGFITFEGSLYVTKLIDESGQLRRVILPSARVRGSAGHGDIIALAMGGERHDQPYIPGIIVYDAASDTLRDIEVAVQFKALEASSRRLNCCGVLVNSKTRSIDVFSLVQRIDGIWAGNRRTKWLTVVHIRVSLDNQTRQSGALDYAIDWDESVRDNHYTMAAPQPTGEGGFYRIQICELPFLGGLPLRLKFAPLFDAERVSLMREDDQEALQLKEPKLDDIKKLFRPMIPLSKANWTMNTRWKGRLYTPIFPSDSWLEYISLMNDTFMVSLEVNEEQTRRSRIRVFCFDPCVHMPDAKILSW